MQRTMKQCMETFDFQIFCCSSTSVIPWKLVLKLETCISIFVAQKLYRLFMNWDEGITELIFNFSEMYRIGEATPGSHHKITRRAAG